MKLFKFFVLFLHLMHVYPEDYVSYKGYRVYEVCERGLKIPKLRIPHTKEKLSVLTERLEYDKENNPLTVRSYLIPQHREEDFVRVLDTVGAQYSISIEDVEEEIEEERRSYEEIGRRGGNGAWNITEKYLSYDEIIDYLKDMGTVSIPGTNEPLAVIEPIGKSLEGREMYLVKISTDHSAKKPIMFIEAGIHAREWTAPSAALYVIDQLVTNHTNTKNVLGQIDFYIIPVANPDGYEYSRKSDRLWRKTRSYHKGHYGVDGNRNFDFHWGEAGTSNNPASEIFRGPFPFSEAETRNIRDAGKKYKERIKVFLSLHAYGPCILYPWAYKITAPAPHADVMERIAKEAAQEIKQYSGTIYTYGVASVLMYEAAGGTDDYFKGVLGVDLSYTLELSSAKKSSFIVPTYRIHGIVSEAFEGIKVMAKNAAHYRKKAVRTRNAKCP